MPVYRQGGASSLAVSNGLKDALPGMKKKLGQIAKETGLVDDELGVAVDAVALVDGERHSHFERGVFGEADVAHLADAQPLRLDPPAPPGHPAR